MTKPRTVFVVGVGPGDPELLTLRASRVLAQCDLIVHPGPEDRAGFAIEVVAPLLHADQSVRGTALMMQRGLDVEAVGYERVAAALVSAARAGRSAAFLTEGDPMLFGTGSHVAEAVRNLAADVPLEVVPGVSAISAAAARLGWPLAQREEVLTICPASYHEEEIGAILDRPGAVCWLKAADVLPRLVDELRKRNRLDRAALVERIGRPEERIFRDLRLALTEKLSYFTLVLVR